MFDVNRTSRQTRIKFCGMTRSEDVAEACRLGVDAVGFVFAERSTRRVDAKVATMLRKTLPTSMASVALFMDQDRDMVRRIIDIVQPSTLQFHGDEDGAFCAEFGLPYLKAVAMSGTDAQAVVRYCEGHPHASGFLFDSHTRGEAGGSGKIFDWTIMPDNFGRPYLLAGGLNPDNVCDAIRATHCHGVDVSSGIESAPGMKDHERMRRFVAEVKRGQQW